MNKVVRNTALLFLGVLIVSVRTVYAQSKAEKIEELVNAYAEWGRFNGSVLVAEKGKIIYQAGRGWANMEWNVPNQPDTKYRLASLTKQFTAMAIMQLVEQGKLKLNEPISTYLPDYPKQNANAITIYHLLTHSSGIPNFSSFPDFFEGRTRNSYTPVEFVKYFADSTLQFKPGEKFAYSNSGYFLLGLIIETVTGESYEHYLRKHIFDPLKMTNTGYDHYNTVLKNRASGYDRFGVEYINTDYLDMSVPYASGSLYSTVQDMYLWDQALYTDQLLKKENRDLLFTKQITSERGSYGLGWVIDEMRIGNTNENIQTIGHSGAIKGFNAFITRIPSEQSAIIFLSNVGMAPLEEMSISINGIIHNKTYNLPQRSIVSVFSDMIQKKGMESALLFYKDAKNSQAYSFDQYEYKMNELAYNLLHAGKIKEALEVFRLNTEAFPNSFNTYESYGEALLALGDKTNAIENYKRSVALNPYNENSLKALKNQGVTIDLKELIFPVPQEELKRLQGDYLISNPSSEAEKKWILHFELSEGILCANDQGYRYKLVPVGHNSFVNADDRASLVFDVKDKTAIGLTLFGKFKFKKIN